MVRITVLEATCLAVIAAMLALAVASCVSESVRYTFARQLLTLA